MAKLPVSVCIIAKNEEKYLEQCLKNLLPYGMEIVVVDTGSTDATREIALRYTDKVYEFAWIDDFSAARNYAAEKASNNWILVLDCDEYVTNLQVSALRICMQQHVRHVGILTLRNIFTQNGQESYKLDEVPRFYNKNFFEYKFRIHEQITPKKRNDKEEVILYTFKLPMEVEHHGYDLSPEEMMRKQERNLKLLESALGETDFDDYLYFQMGQSYFVLNRFEEAAEAYRKCFTLNPNSGKGYMKIAVPAYGRTLMQLGRNEEALKHLLPYEKLLHTAEYMFLLGCAYQACGDTLKAILTLVKVTQLPDIELLGEQAYETYVRIMTLHSMTGNAEGVEHFKQKLLEYGMAHGRQIVFQ